MLHLKTWVAFTILILKFGNSIKLEPDSKNLSVLESGITTAISVINSYRRNHGILTPLEYDIVLDQNAAKWAKKAHDKMVQLARLVPLYSHPHIEGENIFVAGGGGLSPSIAVHNWYAEIKHYDFLTNRFSYKTAQFTQLVWKRTKRVGMASFYDPIRNFTVIVARFKPPGNVGFSRAFKENVLPPRKVDSPSIPVPVAHVANLQPILEVPESKIENPESKRSTILKPEVAKGNSEVMKPKPVPVVLHPQVTMVLTTTQKPDRLITLSPDLTKATAGNKTTAPIKQMNPITSNSTKTFPEIAKSNSSEIGKQNLPKPKPIEERQKFAKEIDNVRKPVNKKEESITNEIQNTKYSHSISAVKTFEGSSEIISVHALEESPFARGPSELQEFHVIKSSAQKN